MNTRKNTPKTKPCDVKPLCYFLATVRPRTLDSYLYWRSSEIISIFIPFRLMEPIHLLFLFLFVCLFGTINCLTFFSLLGCQVFFSKIKDDATTIKTCNDIWLQITKGQHSWGLPKCFNLICCFQSLVTIIDYKCQYYLNKSKTMDITVWTKLGFVLLILLLFVFQGILE